MKTKVEYLVYFLLGAVAGLASGLFGIGGGIVIVPILLLSFAAQGISPEVATHVAIATSLACIAVTSFSSIYTHYQKGVLDWRIIKLLIPGIVTGSLIGTLFFVSLEGVLLQVLLGGFLIISGLQMLIKKSERALAASLKPPILMLSGIGIGGISSLFGVGGGVFTTPLLTHFGVRIHSAIGVAAVGGFCIAVSASIIYGSTAMVSSSLPDHSLGYIFLPAWIGIIITSTPFARLGAILAHRTDANQLRKYFGYFLLFVGARFIWINTTG